MFGSILRNSLLAIAIGSIFFVSSPGALAFTSYMAGASVISWGIDRN